MHKSTDDKHYVRSRGHIIGVNIKPLKYNTTAVRNIGTTTMTSYALRD